MSTPSSSSEDRVEQETPVVRGPGAQVELPLEADEADAAEQSAVVELDEDEHR